MTVKNTIWDMNPITHAKHVILKRYLGAWFPILQSWRVLNYIDGFAGPGIYSKGEKGSPLIAIETAINHKINITAKSNFIFIEMDPERKRMLERVLNENISDIPDNFRIAVIAGKFEDVMSSILKKTKGNLAPTFVFIDPFGLKGFPIKLIKKLLEVRVCEVLITFMCDFASRFCTEYDDSVLDGVFGTEEWKKSKDMDSIEERSKFLIQLYEQQLKDVPDVEYVKSFEMERNNRVLYHLVFATKNIKGLEVMKEAMWKVDPSGQYKFSRKIDSGQKIVFDFSDKKHWIEKAGENIFTRFKGEITNIDVIKEFIISETDYPFRKEILKHLGQTKRIINVERREKDKPLRANTFPDGCIITLRK